MAVDNFDRLIVNGPRRNLEDLRRRLVRTWSRRVAGRTWTERLPFSIQALCDIAPGAHRAEREGLEEAYDVRAWPIVAQTRGQAELRYQLHTRNFELVGFVRALSRAYPALTFRLSTHSLDGDAIESFHVVGGRVRRWLQPSSRRAWHWERARQKFRLSGADVYEDDDAELYAEDGMRDESLDHWVRPALRRDHGRLRSWWNRPVARDFMTERELDLIAFSEEEEEEEEAARAASRERVPESRMVKRSAKARRRTRARKGAR